MNAIPPPPIEVFFAHPKDEPGLDQLTMKLGAALTAGGGRVNITTGEASWNALFRYLGGWPQWIEHVTRSYSVFVVGPRPTAIGHGTANIVKRALQQGREVFAWDETSFSRVQTVYKQPSGDMKNSYTLG